MMKQLGIPVELMGGFARSAGSTEVWECHLEVFQLFQFLSTQWRGGMGGRESLVYREAYARMDELGIRRRKQRLSIMDDLRCMEAEALKAFAEQRRQRS